jgi:hypothetical protein
MMHQLGHKGVPINPEREDEAHVNRFSEPRRGGEAHTVKTVGAIGIQPGCAEPNSPGVKVVKILCFIPDSHRHPV